MWSKKFWMDATERFLSTFAQSLIAFWGIGATDLFRANWTAALSVSLSAAVLSLLKSLTAAKVGDTQSASLVPHDISH